MSLKRLAGVMVFHVFKPLLMRADVIGLGTGSTIKYFIDEMVRHGAHRGKELFVSSIDTQIYLYERGIESRTAVDLGDTVLDIYVDGFDESSTKLDLVKGRGGAFYWEKILARNSRVRVYMADHSKWSGKPYLFLKPVPLEVVRDKWLVVRDVLVKRGLSPRLRMGLARDGPVVTDSGNYIVDVKPGVIRDPQAFDQWLRSIDGVIETGIFPRVLVDYVLVSSGESIVKLYARKG